ncbi:hypothetical protein [Brachyspira sp.]|uniref:hypothetical protein n=1 Tax=Brachyspira sp. TaxID=1977261 RepID=UPI003D7C43B5
MSYDIYNNINEIIKVITQDKLQFNQFMRKAISEYQLGLEYDDNVVAIKKDFIRFIINILQCIESEIDKNCNITSDSAQKFISYYFDKLYNYLFKKNNSKDNECDNEAKQIRNSSLDNMANSSNNINYLSNLICEVLENTINSGILSYDEINKFIMPFIQKINRKYQLNLYI